MLKAGVAPATSRLQVECSSNWAISAWLSLFSTVALEGVLNPRIQRLGGLFLVGVRQWCRDDRYPNILTWIRTTDLSIIGGVLYHLSYQNEIVNGSQPFNLFYLLYNTTFVACVKYVPFPSLKVTFRISHVGTCTHESRCSVSVVYLSLYVWTRHCGAN